MTSSERIRPFTTALYYPNEEAFRKTGELNSAQFCQVLESHVVSRHHDPRPVQGWRGFPWLTLVIGSGCLEVPDASADFALGVSRAIVKQLHADDLGIDEDLLGLVEDFTQSLVRDRLPYEGEPEQAAGHDGDTAAAHAETVKPDAARLVLAAALLTRTYHLAAATTPRAMSRWSNEQVPLDLAHGSTSYEELHRLKDAAHAVLHDVRTRLAKGLALDDDGEVSIRRAVGQLLDDVHHDLGDVDGARVSVQRLRLLTEVAWYFLVRDKDIYPGWTDLLLRLMLAQGARDKTKGTPRRARPRYNSLRELTATATKVLSAATEDSWATTLELCASLSGPARTTAGPAREAALRTGLPPGFRQRFYYAAAATLWAQADAHASPLPGSGDLPPAAAFVTTLDIELEMALAAVRPGAVYLVAVPVYVVPHRAAEEAEFCWLVGDVHPGAELSEDDLDKRLRRPTGWRLLSDRSFRHEKLDRPLVVHLSGCPLIELPRVSELSDALRDDLLATGVSVTASSLLLPAITLDEYLAMRQNEAELSWMNRERDDAHSRNSRALPKALRATLAPKAGSVRYWMVMGVPMTDLAVRHRVMAQLGPVHRLDAASAPTRSLPRQGPLGGASGGSGGGGSLLGAPPAGLLGPSPADEAVEGGEPVEQPGVRPLTGAAVSLRIDDDEVSLLHWLGLDVVEASSHLFARHLDHYVTHLREDGPDKRPPMNERCELTEEVRR